jgi:WD40 repeat protein
VDCLDSQRILCASGTQVSVWDLLDDKWSATIEIGDASSFVNVDFSATHDEVVTVYEFNTQLAICSLKTGEQRVIKFPKCPNSSGYAFRPGTGHLAVLVKLDANDTLTLHEPETYKVITSVPLPTADAQGLKWSPNGAWLAVLEAAAAGTKVVIYTADGQHFRTYTGSTHKPNLGIKTIEWNPDSCFLALGQHDATVELINSVTVCPTAIPAITKLILWISSLWQ